jgi:hypothetical protein
MKKILFVFGFTCFFIACRKPAGVTVTFNGTVTNQKTHLPVKNIKIHFFYSTATSDYYQDAESPVGDVYTDINGNYTFNTQQIYARWFLTYSGDGYPAQDLKDLTHPDNGTSKTNILVSHLPTVYLKIKNTNPFDSHDDIQMLSAYLNNNAQIAYSTYAEFKGPSIDTTFMIPLDPTICTSTTIYWKVTKNNAAHSYSLINPAIANDTTITVSINY